MSIATCPEYGGKGDINWHFSLSALITAKTKDAGERFDRAQWKSFQITMNDSTKFVDMLHNVPWEDGLPKDVIHGKLHFY